MIRSNNEPKKRLRVIHPSKLVGKKEPLKLAPGSLRAESLRLTLKHRDLSKKSHLSTESSFQKSDNYNHIKTNVDDLRNIFEELEKDFVIQKISIPEKEICPECYDIGCDHCTCSNCENLGCGHCYFY